MFAVHVSVRTGILVALYLILAWWRVQGPVGVACPKFIVDRLRAKSIGTFSRTETFRAAFPFNTITVKNSQIASFCLSFKYVSLYWWLTWFLGTNLAKYILSVLYSKLVFILRAWEVFPVYCHSIYFKTVLLQYLCSEVFCWFSLSAFLNYFYLFWQSLNQCKLCC